MLHINIRPSRSRVPSETGLEKHNKMAISNSVVCVLRGVGVVSQVPFESQLPFTTFRPTETLAFLFTGNLKSSTTPSAARWAHPASNTSILTVKEGVRVAITWK